MTQEEFYDLPENTLLTRDLVNRAGGQLILENVQCFESSSFAPSDFDRDGLLWMDGIAGRGYYTADASIHIEECEDPLTGELTWVVEGYVLNLQFTSEKANTIQELGNFLRYISEDIWEVCMAI